MITGAVVKKFLSVIAGHSQDTVLPKMKTTEGVDQALHLSVHPTNAGVVESNHVVTVASQPTRSKIVAQPESVQVAGVVGRNAPSPHEFQCLLCRIVGK